MDTTQADPDAEGRRRTQTGRWSADCDTARFFGETEGVRLYPRAWTGVNTFCTMRNNYDRWIVAVTILAGCTSFAGSGGTSGAASPEPSPSPKVAELGKPFELKRGQSATVSGAELTVGFEGVSEDSRCPTGVQCVWEGDASVEVTLLKPPAEKATRVLHTSAREPREATYQGLKVRLKDLTPQPKEGAPVAAQEYRVTLVVER